MATLKFYKSRSNFKVKVKIMALRERSCHKEYTYEISIFNGLKVMAKVKVFVYAANADADGRAMTSAPRLAKNQPDLTWLKSYGSNTYFGYVCTVTLTLEI